MTDTDRHEDSAPNSTRFVSDTPSAPTTTMDTAQRASR